MHCLLKITHAVLYNNSFRSSIGNCVLKYTHSLVSKVCISLIMSFFLPIFSFWSLSRFFIIPLFIFSSSNSMSLSFFRRFLRRFMGSVVAEELLLIDDDDGLLKSGSVISHLPNLSAASSTAENRIIIRLLNFLTTSYSMVCQQYARILDHLIVCGVELNLKLKYKVVP